MKKCEEFAPLLSAFVDGELTEEERAEVLAHVSECEKCRRLLGELTALQFLQALRRSGKQASELASCCPQYPQELINVAVSHVPGVKDAIMQDPALRHAIAQMEQELAGKGRVLIRPSGTEALIRVMVEAKTTEVARKVAEDLADLIKILSEKIQF